ncbi:aspartate dehydrogenase [uncultured Roseobacter sp.]|uniref:aspartate dehydrogenase n=1 Tax=uncultured Roseobacter sp. TaxID=114847 RepID=UPI0026112778|nr:aspartate dehydrogenase [uncultured Roseobacter sp.]
MHLALIGYGSIGRAIVAWLGAHPVSDLTLLVRSAAIGKTVKDEALGRAADTVQITDDLGTLIAGAPDLVVECAGHSSVSTHCPETLAAGLDTVVISVGALADPALYAALEGAARAGSAQLILPAGAIGGIDLLSALALVDEPHVSYCGTKPPAAWRGTAAEGTCDLSYLSAPKTFFDGSAREAARLYPKNANVAATLALACGSFDRVRVQLIADPTATGNAHQYEVRAQGGTFAFRTDAAASSGNVKTSVSTAYSLIREINRKRATLVI